MIDSIPFIVFIGVSLGVVFGLFYMVLFNRSFNFLNVILLKAKVTAKISQLLSIVMSILITWSFFLYILVISPYISDDLWSYCYTSYFVGVGIGIFFKKNN